MRIDNRNRIRVLRASIAELTSVLEGKLILDDDYKGADIKSSVKVKKNAFMRAKYLLSKLQSLETQEARNEHADWYRDTLNSLVFAAEEAMKELSDVMRRSVKTKQSSASVNSEIDAKQEAYDYINEIFSGVVELQDVVKSIESGDGVRSLNTNDYKSGLAEDHAYYGFYDKKKRKIEPGYNPDLDAVVISYDGTVGDIIDCYGLRIALPKKPRKKDFPNYKKKAEDQYWERPSLPEGLSRATAHIYRDEVEEEFRRRDEGYWFMNNGEPEYITGANYMLLAHYKTDADDGGWFHFRKAHRDLFYFLEACWLDYRSLGAILGKTRRTGATFVAAAFSLTKGISSRDSLFGMTSKKDDDAKKIFEKMSTMFKHLSFIFKPLNTGEGLKKELVFSTPSKRTTRNNQADEVKYDELNTTIDYQATKEDSYDSLKLKFYIGDEFSKWLMSNNMAHWSKVRKTLMTGSIIRGKAFLLSTVEYVTGAEYNDDSAKSGDRFKYLYYQSDLTQRNSSGRTNTGLYKIFISSLDNYEGFIDRYGNCISSKPDKPVLGVDGNWITTGVREYLEELWAPYRNDAQALNDEKRKDPIVESDMFRIASEDSIFNVGKIQDQMDYNDKIYLDAGSHPYKIGNFRWKNGFDHEDGAEFYETNGGRFKISWFPDNDSVNMFRMKLGKKSPVLEIGCFGIDPYKVNKVKYGHGSKGSIIGYIGEHPIDGIPKNSFFLTYIGRPQNLEIFFDDAMMAVVYYSMPALIENNIPELLKVMHAAGLTRYSMRRPDKLKLTSDEAMYGGIPGTDVSLIKNQAAFLQKYVEDHLGYAESDEYREYGAIGDCPFNELLADMMQFDINDRTRFDATVSACLAVYGTQKFLLKNKSKGATGATIKASDYYNFN